MKFKVGDRVQTLLDIDIIGCTRAKGSEGVITDADEDESTFPYVVRFDEKTMGCSNENELEYAKNGIERAKECLLNTK